MPKIINDVREKVLERAKTELFENGYKGVMLKKLAKDCGIAVGTIYNYFSSKDELIAVIIMEDWHKALESMDEAVDRCTSIKEGILMIVDAIKSFSDIYKDVWQQYNDCTVIMPSGIRLRQYQLREQISSYVDRILNKFNSNEGKRFSKYFTELILMCVMQKDTSCEDLLIIAEKLFL